MVCNGTSVLLQKCFGCVEFLIIVVNFLNLDVMVVYVSNLKRKIYNVMRQSLSKKIFKLLEARV